MNISPASKPTDFLAPTPQAWLDKALEHTDILLIDHAHCEKKAASAALHIIFRYEGHTDLLQYMSRLAREELRHFEQVLAIMKKRDMTYRHLTPSRYAEGLRKAMRAHEPARLTDLLIVGAIIEARSCERFVRLIEVLDDELSIFYQKLYQSEARHFQNYLTFAQTLSKDDISERINVFLALDEELITTPDDQFRFHSGVTM